MNEAMDKIRDEMAKNSTDGALCQIGEMMTEMLRERPEIADAILKDGKTLKGAFEAMRTHASKNRNGKSCVCIGPDEAMEIICGYYGIKNDMPAQPAAPEAAPAEDALDLDVFLEV